MPIFKVRHILTYPFHIIAFAVFQGNCVKLYFVPLDSRHPSTDIFETMP